MTAPKARMFYTLRELAGILERVELRFRHAWGDFDGSPYTLDSRRMIVLAEKAVGRGHG